MAEGRSPGTSPSLPPILTPLRRTEDDHAPSIPSPLNPDAASRSTARPLTKPAIVREQREKKDSLKKRESAAAARGVTPDGGSKSVGSAKQSIDKNAQTGVITPMRYTLPTPDLWHYNPARNGAFVSHEPVPIFAPDGVTELRKPVDHAENRRAYRYQHCVADPLFKHKQYYRQSETSPYGPTFSVEDSDRNVHFNNSLCVITNEKGWRSSRANVFAREGSLYYEVKIIKGIPESAGPGYMESTPQPHIRMGWARREAPLDAPVGFDGYSYAVADTKFNTMHRSRLSKLYTPTSAKSKMKKAKTGEQPTIPSEPIRTGDVIGLLITLPPLPLHRKVVAGTYNPAVDFSPTPDPNAPPPDVVRDRIPVPYRNNLYFETLEYQPTKPMISYNDRVLQVNASASSHNPNQQSSPSSGILKPHPNHEEPQLRTLPNSSIKVWKNGVLVGTAFEGLMAFLPPASLSGSGANSSRGDLDDGALGYFPCVSVFSGGVVEANFGPDFWAPPQGLDLSGSLGGTTIIGDGDVQMGDDTEEGDVMRPRGIGERYHEQIAEDVVWDIVDEAAFYAQDGGDGSDLTV